VRKPKKDNSSSKARVVNSLRSKLLSRGSYQLRQKPLDVSLFLQESQQAFLSRLLDYFLSQSKDGGNQIQVEEAEQMLRSALNRSQIFHLREKFYAKREIFFNLRNRIKMFCGGNQIAKTTSIISEIVACCLGFRPWAPTEPPLVVSPTGRAILCGPDYSNWCSENLIPKMRELFPFDACITAQDKMQGGITTKITFYSGWTIKIMSYEQDTDKYESWTANIVGFDEPPPQDKWTATLRGCVKNSAPILLAYTPISEPWTYEFLYEKALHVNDYETLKAADNAPIAATTATLFENPYLTDAQKEWWASQFAHDPDEAEARLYGKYRHLQGRVYKTFDIVKHVKDLELFL